jgi:hypothetical protein
VTDETVQITRPPDDVPSGAHVSDGNMKTANFGPATPPPAVLREPFRIAPNNVVRKQVDTGVPSGKKLQDEFNAIFEKHAEADAIALIEDEFHGHLQNCKDIKADRATRYSQGNYISTLMVLARMNVEIRTIVEFQRNRRVELQKQIAALESQLASLQARSDEGRKLSKTITSRRDKDGNLVADVFVEAPPLSALEERIANLEAEGIKFAVVPLHQQIRTLEARAATLEARPWPKYEGIFETPKHYPEASFVTHDGSVWYANEDVQGDVPGFSRKWVLAVKHGRDARGVR